MDELEFNDHDLPLADLVDNSPTISAHPDALRAIVARSDRFRIRGLALALAAVAVAGPLAGYAAGHAGSAKTTVASASRTTDQPAPVAGSANSSAGASLATGAAGAAASGTTSLGYVPSSKQLFVRDTNDGVRIRAYLQDFPTKKLDYGCAVGGPPSSGVANPLPPTSPPAAPETTSVPKSAIAPAPPPCYAPILPVTCMPTGLLQGELSNDQVAGSIEAPVMTATAGQPLDVLDANVVGAGQPTPIGTVLVHTTPAVAKVVLTFKSGGSDEMAPTADGYAILAHGIAGLALATPNKTALPPKGAPEPSNVSVRALGFGFPEATVTSFDASGKQLSSLALPGTVSFVAPDCIKNSIGIGTVNGAPATGTAATGTASSGSGATGRATTTPASKP